MSKIIGCIDGSVYADSVSYYSAWLHERTGLPIELLHVVAPHSEIVVRGDLSGQIGVSSNSNLLEKLTKIDEEHGKLEQSKGKLLGVIIFIATWLSIFANVVMGYTKLEAAFYVDLLGPIYVEGIICSLLIVGFFMSPKNQANSTE